MRGHGRPPTDLRRGVPVNTRVPLLESTAGPISYLTVAGGGGGGGPGISSDSTRRRYWPTTDPAHIRSTATTVVNPHRLQATATAAPQKQCHHPLLRSSHQLQLTVNVSHVSASCRPRSAPGISGRPAAEHERATLTTPQKPAKHPARRFHCRLLRSGVRAARWNGAAAHVRITRGHGWPIMPKMRTGQSKF